MTFGIGTIGTIAPLDPGTDGTSNYISDSAAAFIAGDSGAVQTPAGVAQLPAQQTSGASSEWTILAVALALIGGWYWYEHEHGK